MIFETKHLRMEQAKFVEYSLQKFEVILRSFKTDHITTKFLKAVFHKFYFCFNGYSVVIAFQGKQL